MTILGPDLSSYQDGVNVTELPHPFVIAKCTEGTYYSDADYPTWRQQAATSGKVFLPYHFISAEDPDAQAKHLSANIGDATLPVMIDFEPASGYSPTLAQLLAVADACYRAGLHIALAYLPRWYHQQIGSPDLRALDSRGISLVSSAYPGGSAYPGDSAAGWQAYGGMTPLIYQFTDDAPVQGHAVDMNAYRGSIAAFASTLTPSGAPVSSYTMSAGWQTDYSDVAVALQQHIPVGTIVDDGTAAAYAMIRSFVAAERAGAIETKLDQLLSHLATPPTTPTAPPVDVDALAAALGPHLTAGATPDQLAHAVVMHLGSLLQAG